MLKNETLSVFQVETKLMTFFFSFFQSLDRCRQSRSWNAKAYVHSPRLPSHWGTMDAKSSLFSQIEIDQQHLRQARPCKWKSLKTTPKYLKITQNSQCSFYFPDNPQLNAQVPTSVPFGPCQWYFAITLLNFQNLCIQWDHVLCCDCISKWENHSAQNWS